MNMKKHLDSIGKLKEFFERKIQENIDSLTAMIRTSNSIDDKKSMEDLIKEFEELRRSLGD